MPRSGLLPTGGKTQESLYHAAVKSSWGAPRFFTSLRVGKKLQLLIRDMVKTWRSIIAIIEVCERTLNGCWNFVEQFLQPRGYEVITLIFLATEISGCIAKADIHKHTHSFCTDSATDEVNYSEAFSKYRNLRVITQIVQRHVVWSSSLTKQPFLIHNLP
jgi:hypothetical protein